MAAPLVNLDPACTPLSRAARDAVVRWLDRVGDADGPRAAGRDSRKMRELFRDDVCRYLDCARVGGRGFRLSLGCAHDEAVCGLIAASCRAYATKTSTVPHIIVGATASPAVMLFCHQLERDGLCVATLLPVGRWRRGFKEAGESGAAAPAAFTVPEAPPDDTGSPGPADAAPKPAPDAEPKLAYGEMCPTTLRKLMRSNTCMLTIAAGSFDLGAVSGNLERLAEVSRKHRVPVHVDLTAWVGVLEYPPPAGAFDAWSFGFTSMGGPAGVSVLAVSNDFQSGYDLRPLAGAPNIALVAGAAAAWRESTADRLAKARRLADAAETMRAQAEARRDARVRFIRPGGTDGMDIAARTVWWLGPEDAAREIPGSLLLAVTGGARRFAADQAAAALEGDGFVAGLPKGRPAPAALGAKPTARTSRARVAKHRAKLLASLEPDSHLGMVGLPLEMHAACLRVAFTDGNVREAGRIADALLAVILAP